MTLGITRQFATVKSWNYKGRHTLTLDPNRMVEVGQPCMDISNVTTFWLRFPSLDSKKLSETSMGSPLPFSEGRISCSIGYRAAETHPKSGKYKHLPFPSGTSGVLYYHQSILEESSSVRFRICHDVDELSFKSGRDLILPPREGEETTPWHVPLHSIASLKTFGAFQQLLLDDKLVDPALLKDITHPRLINSRAKILYSLNDPFVMDVSTYSFRCRFMSRKGLTDKIEFSWGPMLPYLGKVRAQFVLSDLPVHRHNPSVLLRFLDILTPIRPSIPEATRLVGEPKVGEYLRRNGKVWSYSLKETVNGRQIASVFDIPIDQ
ncbi:hypothetical protein CPC08DRAFT_714603 [Agrocybe pediades]|nr:hypothetical protein CPC08DRAFT_714603 [Agrocybe pediades]